MSALTTYGRSVLLSSLFRPEAAPSLSTLWLALTMTVPVATDTGTSINEPTASSYARLPYGVGASYWSMPGPGQLINSRNVDWAVPDDDWGQVIGWALCTESMSGMAVGYGPLQRPLTVTVGTRLRLPAGAVRLNLQ